MDLLKQQLLLASKKMRIRTLLKRIDINSIEIENLFKQTEEFENKIKTLEEEIKDLEK